MSLIDHLESFAGPIEAGWINRPDGERMPFQIAAFSGGPFEGSRMISTLGLSHYELLLSDGVTHGRHELIMLVERDFDANPLAAILHQVGMECLEAHLACVRGRVIGPRGTLVSNSSMTALYCAAPVYFPEEFAEFEQGTIKIRMMWLVPTVARASPVTRSAELLEISSLHQRAKPCSAQDGDSPRPSTRLAVSTWRANSGTRSSRSCRASRPGTLCSCGHATGGRCGSIRSGFCSTRHCSKADQPCSCTNFASAVVIRRRDARTIERAMRLADLAHRTADSRDQIVRELVLVRDGEIVAYKLKSRAGIIDDDSIASIATSKA